jgi:glycosyltransferase involved in cell wall biosynthesis
MISIVSIVFTAAWCTFFLWAIASSLSVPVFERTNPVQPKAWPRLSVVIPACNEAEQVAAAGRTLMQQDYPELEILYVNDRSNDATEEVIGSLAGTDPRVRMISVSDLPEGWLGKVHALDVGTRNTGGDWILYTDADVHFEKTALRRAVAVAMEKGADHLTLIPSAHGRTFWLEVLLQTFAMSMVAGRNVTRIGKPGTRTFIGSGGFNLVRRSALEKTPGFQWLRMEVVDDLGLGFMLNRSGARSWLGASLREVHLDWYPNARSLFKGFEKNGFATMRFKIGRTIASVLVLLAFFLAPWFAALALPALWAEAALVTAAVSFGSFVIVWKRRFRRPILPALLIPLGPVLLVAILLRSSVRCLRQGGVTWRDTFYPLEQLRAGRRMK